MTAAEMPYAITVSSVAWRRLTAPNTVIRIARPREPPTCCMTLSRLEAAPASYGSRFDTARMIKGTTNKPMPRPNSSIGLRILST